MKIKLLVILSAIFMLQSCGGNSATTADSLFSARQYISRQEYTRASDILENVTADSARFNSLTVSELCDVAEMYLTLAANPDLDSLAPLNEANAARCMGRAQALDADSVDLFLARAETETALRLHAISKVGSYLSIPRDSLVIEDEQTDSI